MAIQDAETPYMPEVQVGFVVYSEENKGGC